MSQSSADRSAVHGLRRHALIDLDALAATLRDAVAGGSSVLDARADAYGHSLALVAPVALAAGVRTLLLTDERDAAVAAAAGYRPDRLVVGRSARLPGGVVADPWGLAPDALRPVMTLVAEVVAVKRAAAGAGVSYGYTFRTTRPTTLALVGLGYADGVPRLASNRAAVLIEGLRHPLAGRVAMDQFVVDCGDAVPTRGAEVVLFGAVPAAPTAAEWAAATERPASDLTGGLGQRVVRIGTGADPNGSGGYSGELRGDGTGAGADHGGWGG